MGEFRVGRKFAQHSYPDPPRAAPTGPTGPTGGTGPGPTGPTGPTGASGGLLDFATFYALMPPDNAAPIAAGSPVAFPNNGPSAGGSIVPVGDGFNFTLQPGTYEIAWQVSVTEAGQLALATGGGPYTILPDTVVSRATGSSQLVGDTIITVGAPTVVAVINPAGNTPALTITPHAGQGPSLSTPVSATITFKKLA